MEDRASGFLLLFSGATLKTIFRILITIVLARLLTPKDFGLLSAANIVIGFSALFTSFGLGASLVQTKNLDQDKINTALTFSMIAGLFWCFLILALNQFISSFFNMPNLKLILNYLVILFPLNSLSHVSVSLLQRAELYKRFAGLDAVSYIVGFGLIGIPLALLGYGVWSLVYGHLVQASLYAILLLYLTPNRFGFSFSKKAFQELIWFGSGISVAQVFNYFARKVDFLVVGKVLGEATLGLYSKAYSVLEIANNLIGKSIHMVLFSKYAKAETLQTNHADSVIDLLGFNFLIFMPSSLFFYLLGNEIVNILLGPQWGAAVVSFKILVLGLAGRMGYKIIGSYILGIGKSGVYAIIQCLYFILILVSSSIGAYWNSIEIVAMLVTISIYLNFILILGYFLRLNTKLTVKSIGSAMMDGVKVSLLLVLFLFPLNAVITFFELSSLLHVMVVILLLLMISYLVYHTFGSQLISRRNLVHIQKMNRFFKRIMVK